MTKQVANEPLKTTKKLPIGVKIVAPSFENKTRYIPYVSLGIKISYIATNKGNINRQ